MSSLYFWCTSHFQEILKERMKLNPKIVINPFKNHDTTLIRYNFGKIMVFWVYLFNIFQFGHYLHHHKHEPSIFLRVYVHCGLCMTFSYTFGLLIITHIFIFKFFGCRSIWNPFVKHKYATYCVWFCYLKLIFSKSIILVIAIFL